MTGVVAAVLSVALVACGDSSENEGAATATATADGQSASTNLPVAQSSKCDSVDLSKPPAKPVTFRVANTKGNDGYAPMFIIDGNVPASTTPNKGRWYDYKPLYLDSGSDNLKAFLAGQVDAYVAIAPQSWIGSRQDVGAKAVATVVINKEGTSQEGLYVTRDDGSVPDVKSLVGKKIGMVSLAGLSGLYAKAMVLAGGGKIDDAQYIVMPFPALADAVQKGQIDAAPAAEPQITQLRKAGAPVQFLEAMKAISDLAGGGITEHDVGHLFVGDKFLSDPTNQAAVCAFLADLNQAHRFWEKNPALVRQNFLDNKFVVGDPDIYLDPDFPAPPLPDDGMPINVTTGQKIVDLALQTGVITEDQTPDWNNFVSPLANTK